MTVQRFLIPHLSEIEDDFHDGWYWAYLSYEEDTGPEYGPFLGKQQLLLGLYKNELEDFFRKCFLHLCSTLLQNLKRICACLLV